MLMVDKERVRGTIAAIKEKLANAQKKAECIADIENMIDIKQAHIWRADAGSCCGNVCNISSLIGMEIGILQDAIEAIQREDTGKAASLLENYVAFIEENYQNEHPPY
jgi:hypothetical protein